MKRSTTAVATLLRITAVGCDGQSDAQTHRGSAGTGGTAAVRPMAVEEARQVVVSLNKREDTKNWNAAYWRKVAEGPWLEPVRQLKCSSPMPVQGNSSSWARLPSVASASRSR